jgi:hypothetical protein
MYTVARYHRAMSPRFAAQRAHPSFAIRVGTVSFLCPPYPSRDDFHGN